MDGIVKSARDRSAPPVIQNINHRPNQPKKSSCIEYYIRRYSTSQEYDGMDACMFVSTCSS